MLGLRSGATAAAPPRTVDTVQLRRSVRRQCRVRGRSVGPIRGWQGRAGGPGTGNRGRDVFFPGLPVAGSLPDAGQPPAAPDPEAYTAEYRLCS
jgi:hypothetical protein